MRPIIVTALFASALWVALACASVAEIYVFAHFEGAIGGRIDNLLLTVLIDAAVAVLCAAGFGAMLWSRHVASMPRRPLRIWLPASGAVACGLILLPGITGLARSDLFGMWQVNILLFGVYGLVVGALIAFALVRGLDTTVYAA